MVVIYFYDFIPMGVYLYRSGTKKNLKNAYIGEGWNIEYKADFSSSTGWTIQQGGSSGSLTISDGSATAGNWWGGIYQDISSSIDFTGASKVEIEYKITPYKKAWSGGAGVVLGGQVLSGGEYTGSDGTRAWVQVATSQGAGPGIVVAGNDVYTGLRASDVENTETSVRALIDLGNKSYGFYLNGVEKSSGSISTAIVTAFNNVNNQYLCVLFSEYCSFKDLYIRVI